MTKELKIRLYSKPEILARLKDIGAKYEGISDTVHTYFNQPEGKVLKIVLKNGAAFVHKLREENGFFLFDSREPVDDPNDELARLELKYGIKNKQKMHAELYSFKDYSIGLYDIEELGQFLILDGDNPSVQKLEDWLSIKDPEIITKSFADL
ncbi:MAG: hypothetical protein AAB971_03570 [Patescibacteria group bacterium]